MIQCRLNGSSIKARHSKVLFCGSSAVGKSNFVNLLLCKKFEEKHIPTSVTKPHHLLAKQVTIVKSASSSTQCKLEHLDEKTQIQWLKWFLHNGKYHTNIWKSVVAENESINLLDVTESITDTRAKDKPELAHVQPENEAAIQTVPSSRTLVEKKVSCESDMPQGNPPDVWNMLTFLDTGGQPAFINMLPAVNSSAMITFIMLSMEHGVESLNEKVTVYGDGPNTYSLDYDNADLVKMLFSMRKPKEFQEFDDLLVEHDKKGDKNCYLSLVGTKSDLCKLDSVTVAKNMYKKLEPIIDQTVRKSSLIDIDGTYFVPVSNCKAGTADEDPVATKFRNCIYKCLEGRDMYYIPIVWLILELEIQMRAKEDSVNVVPFDNIFKICQDCNLIKDEADVRAALQFFHHIGVFLYYGSDEEMKNIADVVITDYEWIFKNLNSIVQVAKSDKPIAKELRKYGILNKELVKFIEWDKTDNISEKYFLKLLEKLGIIAPTNNKGGEFFIPCVLQSFESDPQCLLEEYDTQGKAEPLLMQLVHNKPEEESHFRDNKSYAFPAGVFCCLVNQLLLGYPRFQVQLSLVYNNLVELYDTKQNCYVVLVDKYIYLEIQIRHSAVDTDELAYCEIKSKIESELQIVCKKLKLHYSHISVGFRCSKCSDFHLTRKTPYSEQNKDLTFYCQYNKPQTLKATQKIWFTGQL